MCHVGWSHGRERGGGPLVLRHLSPSAGLSSLFARYTPPKGSNNGGVLAASKAIPRIPSLVCFFFDAFPLSSSFSIIQHLPCII